MSERVFALAAYLMIGACASIAGCHGRAISPSSAKLGVTFDAPSEVQLGDSAPLHLVVTNRSNEEIRLSLWTGGGLAFDPVVSRFSDGDVWRRSDSGPV